jgi:outer membrane protein assembly factor BamB
LASSLEQNGQHVFAWIEREDDPYVLAISKDTGKTVWKSDGLGVTTWSSPRLVPVGDRHHLVLSGIGKLAGLDPQTGKRLWDFDDIAGNSTPTPVPLGDGRFLIGASVGRGESVDGPAAASNGVIQIDELVDGRFEAKYAWRNKRATSSFGSPVAHKGHAYFVNRTGVVYCLDLESGEEKYAQRTAESTWATPIATADRIYLFGRSGTTTVIKSGSEFGRLAENKVWEDDAAKPEPSAGPPGMSFGGPVLYAAVAVDRKFVLRRGDVLYAIALEDSANR